MKQPRRKFWLLVFVTLVTGILSQGATAEGHHPEPFTRVSGDKEESRSLQTAIRKLQHPDGGPVIFLTGVAHIGNEAYFDRLQKHLGELSLVLYEGVGDVAKGEKKERVGSVQTTLADSLGLHFQLDAIDYDRENFRNSDMSLEQIGFLMSGGDKSKMPPREAPSTRKEHEEETSSPQEPEGEKVITIESADPQTNPEFDRLMQVMDGTTAMGALVDGMVRLIGSSPKLQALTKLVFVELLGGLKGDLSESPVMTPDMKEMITVLIRSRNELVLEDLKKAIKDSANRSISIFYGAGHMDDLETRLVEKMGYEVKDTEWVTAFTVNFEEEGISRAERTLIQYFINLQLQMIQPPKQVGKEAEKEAAKEADPASR